MSCFYILIIMIQAVIIMIMHRLSPSFCCVSIFVIGTAWAHGNFFFTSRGTMDWSLPKDGHISYSYHLLLTLFIICLLSVSSEGWVMLVTPNLHIYIDCCLYHIQYHQTASDIEGSYKSTQWYAGLNVAKDCSFISLLFSPE